MPAARTGCLSSRSRPRSSIPTRSPPSWCSCSSRPMTSARPTPTARWRSSGCRAATVSSSTEAGSTKPSHRCSTSWTATGSGRPRRSRSSSRSGVGHALRPHPTPDGEPEVRGPHQLQVRGGESAPVAAAGTPESLQDSRRFSSALVVWRRGPGAQGRTEAVPPYKGEPKSGQACHSTVCTCCASHIQRFVAAPEAGFTHRKWLRPCERTGLEPEAAHRAKSCAAGGCNMTGLAARRVVLPLHRSPGTGHTVQGARSGCAR